MNFEGFLKVFSSITVWQINKPVKQCVTGLARPSLSHLVPFKPFLVSMDAALNKKTFRMSE